jgi:hypothetical protein
MSASLFSGSRVTVVDENGPVAGALIYVYLAGGLLPAVTYNNQSGAPGTENDFPVQCNAYGQAVVWTDAVAHRVIVTTPGGVVLSDDDNISNPDSTVRADLAVSSDATMGDALVAVKLVATGAVARTQHSKNADLISVRDFGALGDGLTDDTLAIQAAINYALSVRGEVFFPANLTGQFYKVTAPLTVTGPLKLTGAGPGATTLYGAGMAAGTYVLDINCLAASVVESLLISDLTIRADGVPNGLRIKNASYVTAKNLYIRNVTNGIDLDGTRCFSNSFEQVTIYSVTGEGVKFLATFAGGGQWVFAGCTFTGNTGLFLATTAGLDGLGLFDCNFEACVTNSLYLGGTARGTVIHGCRTEKCGGDDFQINPAGGQVVQGLSILGCTFNTNSAAYRSIILGGAGGTVRGFHIAGNTSYTANLGAAFVTLNGEGESGTVTGNYFTQTNTTAINTPRAGVFAFGNENATGKVQDYWGLAGLIATPSAAPTIASAGTVAPTKRITFISGTAAIATITPPAPIASTGGEITFIPTGIYTTTTAGNIGLASTAVVGKAMTFFYDVTSNKWYPSY